MRRKLHITDKKEDYIQAWVQACESLGVQETH